MLIDSHCHLDRIDLAPYGQNLGGLLQACAAVGVRRMLCVGIDLETYPVMRRLVDPYSEIDVAVGVHPNVREGEDPSIARLLELAADPRVVAIGETGLDYYRLEHGDPSTQQARFRTHIAAARACGKPLIIHTREARADTLRLLREEGAEAVGGVLHCFSEDWATARTGLDLGFYVSFSGIITFKSAAALREVARQVPLDRVLIETDAPYLAPVPHRGKPNAPTYLPLITACLAQVHGITVEQLAALLAENYHRLFAPAAWLKN